MALQVSDFADLVNTTKQQFGPMSWTDLSTDLQEYYALPKLLKKEKVVFDDGRTHEFRVSMDHNSQAAFVGLAAVDNYNLVDTVQVGTVPWRHWKTDYSWEFREALMNRGASRIVDLVKKRRADGMISLASTLESALWGFPAAGNTTELYGFMYYVVINSSTGFNGGAPSGYTVVANLNPTTYARWKNYTAQYTSVTKPDLIYKTREAMIRCRFKPPVDIPENKRGSNRWALYTNRDVWLTLADLAEAQNENLGNDLASKDGNVTIGATSVQWVPYLDSSSSVASQDPLYGIDWSSFYFAFLKGDYMRESDAHEVAGQHNVIAVDVDCTGNLVCTNRRNNFVMATA